MAIQPEINCPITVAKAAPLIPILRENTKTLSKTVLITAPVKLQNIVIFGLPSARIRCPPPVDKIRNGNPNAVILVYSTAYPSTFSGEPKKTNSGRRKISVIIANTTPQIKSMAAAFPIIRTAFLLSPLPIARLNADAPPIPRSRAIARQDVESGNAIFVAAFPNSPILLPIKN